jgi:hypothetical protein
VTRVIFALAAALACRGPFMSGQPGPREAIPVTRLRETAAAFTDYSGFADPLYTVVRDSLAWQQAWHTLNKPFIPPPPLPAIDFQRQVVVVAALGARPSGGYDILIENATEDSTGVEIGVRVTRPGTGCITPAVVTQPVDVATIPVTRRTIHFREHSIAVTCGIR